MPEKNIPAGEWNECPITTAAHVNVFNGNVGRICDVNDTGTTERGAITHGIVLFEAVKTVTVKQAAAGNANVMDVFTIEQTAAELPAGAQTYPWSVQRIERMILTAKQNSGAVDPERNIGLQSDFTSQKSAVLKKYRSADFGCRVDGFLNSKCV